MLRLRPFKASDARYMLEWVKDEKAFTMWCANRFDYPLTEEQLIEYKRKNDEDEFAWSFTVLDDEGKPVGHFVMRCANYEQESIHLGFVILDDQERGKGYGKEMMNLAVKYAFELLGVKKITLGVFANNPAAHYCYLAVGFTDVKLDEKYFTYKEEKWDLCSMEMIK